ncbi:hypothetical protein [Ktedonosporobacter rubrisoli]|nr:hypothetical protein [Ktedonosporobacter rubrisoli]
MACTRQYYNKKHDVIPVSFPRIRGGVVENRGGIVGKHGPFEQE